MSNELTQWLAQIRSLKQQLVETQSDRDAAHESAANWRQLYNTEAQQRRTESKLAQQQIDVLKSEIRQLKTGEALPKADTPEASAAIDEAIANLSTVEELKAKLIEVLQERDRLLDTLKTEQSNHVQTRKSLTAVIGDTVDQLAKERGQSKKPESSS